jgi:hypothetical protein
LLPQIDVDPGFVLQFVYELWVKFGAGGGQGTHNFRGVGIAMREHAPGGVRGLTAGLAAFDYEYRGAALGELQGDAEPYDTASDDDRVPGLHIRIVAKWILSG